MKYIIDHDLHIHSQISPCAADVRQTKEAILAYGLCNHFKLVGVTDHFWDEKVDAKGAPGWDNVGNKAWSSVLPLPQSPHCRMLMGAEVDMNMFGVIGMSRETMDTIDYMVLSMPHYNLTGFTIDPEITPRTPKSISDYYKKRLDLFLNQTELPFEKIGLGHFTRGVVIDEDLEECLNYFSDKEFEEIFSQVAKLGVGVELNFSPDEHAGSLREAVLRPYYIAKEQGCKFYLGSDAHNPEPFMFNKANFERLVDVFTLTEDDKWDLVKTLGNNIQ